MQAGGYEDEESSEEDEDEDEDEETDEEDTDAIRAKALAMAQRALADPSVPMETKREVQNLTVRRSTAHSSCKLASQRAARNSADHLLSDAMILLQVIQMVAQLEEQARHVPPPPHASLAPPSQYGSPKLSLRTYSHTLIKYCRVRIGVWNPSSSPAVAFILLP